ncbi:MAG: type II toxin-antitoxin system VapC family toxin [Myxococcota bacterium]|nr:type II toxin-antitoxin system VapC family toxin [Myxococcota bacterium]
MSRAYLDACTIIYLVEGVEALQRQVKERLEHVRARPDASLVTSRLARLECRTGPLREGRTGLLGTYDEFFAAADLCLAEVSAAVIERATDLRARYRLCSPDAIHLATAIEQRADVFITGDKRLRSVVEVPVELVGEVGR